MPLILRYSSMLLVVALLACGQPFSASTETSSVTDTSSTGTTAGGPPSTTGGSGGAGASGGTGGSVIAWNDCGISDDFSGDTLEPMWSVLKDDFRVALGKGRLHVQLNGAWAACDGIRSHATFKLKDCSMAIKVVKPHNQSEAAILFFGASTLVGTNPEKFLALVLDGDNLRLAIENGDKDTATAPIAYETSHLWWRIREKKGKLHFDVSANGIDWTSHGQLATPAFASSVHATIGGCTTALLQLEVGTAEFDNFNVPPNP